MTKTLTAGLVAAVLLAAGCGDRPDATGQAAAEADPTSAQAPAVTESPPPPTTAPPSTTTVSPTTTSRVVGPCDDSIVRDGLDDKSGDVAPPISQVVTDKGNARLAVEPPYERSERSERYRRESAAAMPGLLSAIAPAAAVTAGC